jgi:hypothetical protein
MENGDLVVNITHLDKKPLTLIEKVTPEAVGGFYSTVRDNETGREYYVKSYNLAKFEG